MISRMEARKNPEYLRSVAQAVADFRDALTAFLGLHVLNGEPGRLGGVARGIAPAVLVRDGTDPEELERRRTRVGRAAGLAVSATPLTDLALTVQGIGTVDPIRNWATIAQPKPVLEPANILDAYDHAAGRLEGLIMQAEAERPPSVGAEAMHPAVWSAAGRLWRDGHFRQAVTASAEAVVLMVKNRTRRNDIAETALWQEAFSSKDPQPGKPRLRWPGNPTDRDVTTMTDGLRQFAPGVQMTIRNSAAHGVGEFGEQDALERLSALSLLARWVDECELVEAIEAESPPSGGSGNSR